MCSQSFIFSSILKAAELLPNPLEHLLVIQRLTFAVVLQENAPGQAEHTNSLDNCQSIMLHATTLIDMTVVSSAERGDKQLSHFLPSPDLIFAGRLYYKNRLGPQLCFHADHRVFPCSSGQVS